MEHIALYRQFRPMTFDEIVEQKGPVSSLRQSVVSGKIGHAYLFSGQRGTGKTSIAKVFSRAINCENPVNGNPCNKCAICQGIISGSLMDVIEIDAASNNSVDNIRRICEEVNFAPSKASHKVYIIDEVHMLSTGAFNALLKTLEEPPKHVVFLLATTEPHRIPATIHSRCQRYDFKRISIDSIVKRLQYICDQEGFDATTDALSLIASLSDGAMRDAISLLDQAGNSSSDKKITRDSVLQITGTVDDTFIGNMAKALIGGDYASIITMCEELANSGRDITRFSVDLAQYFRDLLVVRMMPDPTKLVKVQTSTLKTMYEICQNVAAETLVAFISKLSAMISDLKWTPSVRTTFEITLIQLCGRKVKVEPVPLVIPDFVAKQQAFAKGATISVSAPKVTASDKSPIEKVEVAAPSVAPTTSEKIAPAPETKVEAPVTEDSIITSIVAEVASVHTEVAPEAEIVPKKAEPKPEVKVEEKAEAPKEAKTPSVAPSFMDDMLPPPEEEVAPAVSAETAPAAPVAPEVPVAPIAPEAPVAPSVPAIPTATIAPAMDSDIPDPEPPPENTDVDYDDPYLAADSASFSSELTITAPANSEPEIDPEDLPMENQIDLFSMPATPAEVSKPSPVAPKAPVAHKSEPETKSETSESKSPLLAMLNSSFLDDIENLKSEPTITTYNDEAKTPTPAPAPVPSVSEPAAPFWEPTPSAPQKERPTTSLAAALKGNELVTEKTAPVVAPEAPAAAPTPASEVAVSSAPSNQAPAAPIKVEAGADLQVIWKSIYSRISTEDYLMFLKLSQTTLQKIGKNAYIVFDNSYNVESLRQLTLDDLYKKIRNDVMAVLSDVEHLYVANEKQYKKVLETNGQSKPNLEQAKKETNLDSFLNAAKLNGVDLHFGDD